MSDMELLYEDHRAVEDLALLPGALERLWPVIFHPNNPIPGLPSLPADYPLEQDGDPSLVRTPWGAAEVLWGSRAEGLWSFTPLYRLVTPNDRPLPEPRIPRIGYAAWDTVTGLVAVHADDGGEPVYHLRLDRMERVRQAVANIRADLAWQGIPVYPSRLYRSDSLPCPWDDAFKTPRVTNREVGVPLVGYALDRYQGEVVYLHIVGAKSAIRSIWATLNQGAGRKPLYIDAEHFLTGSPTGNYVSYSSPVLADTGDYRMVILDRRAAGDTAKDTAYLVIPKDQEPGQDDLYAVFAARLDDVLAIPILPGWGERLYQEGLSLHLTRPLVCGGDVAAGYAIANDPRWIELVQSLIQSGELEV